jgi:serine/threonine-protein kinase
MRGTTVADRYRLVETIGSGGMGEVWRAEDLTDGRDVAVKVIPQGGDDAVGEATFRREAGVAARLSHPHVVAVHDHGVADLDGLRVLFLAMDLVDGQPLSTLATGSLPIADILTWAAQISQALQAAHRAGIVHRDVKPSNVLINHRGDAVLCDFGIARLAGLAHHTLTVTGAVIGTPTYMSPEQARGDKALAAPSDLYSLGCVMYELLTGVTPFTGSGWRVLGRHLHDTPIPLSALRTDVPQELELLVLELLDKDPGRRPTAVEAADRLVRLRSGLATVPTSPPNRVPLAPTVIHTPHSAPGGCRPRPWATALWAGTVTGVAIAGELAWTTAMVPPWSLTAGALGGLLLSSCFLLDPPRLTDRQTELQITTAGLFTMLLLALGAALAQMISHPSQWMAALATTVLGGPLLVACTTAVRRAAQGLLHRSAWHADLASTAGALTAAALLLAAALTGLPAVTSLAAAAVLWPSTALITATITPSETPHRRITQPSNAVGQA